MPKQTFTMGLIRALRNAASGPAGKYAHEYGAPYFGDMTLRAGDMLKSVGLGNFAGPAVNAALSAYEHAPKIISALADYIDEPNATFVPPSAADKASAFVGDPAGVGEGNGMLLFGNDQPSRVSDKIPLQQPPIPVIYQKTPLGAENAFEIKRLPEPSDASVAGPYFRKVGKGTNIVDDAPGFGEQVTGAKAAGKVARPLNRNPAAAKKDLKANKERINKLQKKLEEAAGDRKNIKQVLITKEKKAPRKYTKAI